MWFALWNWKESFEILFVKNDEKNYLVPYNFDIILDVDLEKREMKVKNIVGLFD